MSADRKKPAPNTRKRITECQRKKINEIVAEADGSPPKPLTPTEQFARLKEELQDSERKRRKLAEALHTSRDSLRKIRGLPGEDEQRALPFGVFVREGRRTPDGETAIIRHHGRLYEAKILEPDGYDTPGPKGATFHALRQRSQKKDALRQGFRPGELLLLNNDLHIVEGRGFDLVCGSLATVEQVLNDQKLLVRTVGDETILVTRAEPMKPVSIVIGDNVEYDPDSLFVYSLLPKSGVGPPDPGKGPRHQLQRYRRSDRGHRPDSRCH